MNYQNKIYTIFITIFITLSTTTVAYLLVEEKLKSFDTCIDKMQKENLAAQKEKISKTVNDIYFFLNSETKKITLEKKIGELKKHSFYNNVEVLILDREGKVLFETLKDDINTGDLLNNKDNNGKLYISDILKASKKADGGFVFYSWDKPFKVTKQNNKISYARSIDSITISAATFIDNIDNKLALLEKNKNKEVKKIVNYSLILYMIELIIILIFSIVLYKKTNKFKTKEIEQLLIDIERENVIDHKGYKLKEYSALIDKVNELKGNYLKANNALLELKRSIKDKISKDYLTNLPNKKYFIDLAKGVISISKREKTPITLIMIDIKNFKSISDKYGHDISDNIIKDFSIILKTTIRESDIASRIFGDTFSLLLHNTDKDGATVLVKRLLGLLKDHKIVLKQHKISYEINYGIAQLKDDEITDDPFNELIKQAEREIEIFKKS